MPDIDPGLTVLLQIDQLRTVRECASRGMVTTEHKTIFASASAWDKSDPELAALYAEIEDKYGDLLT